MRNTAIPALAVCLLAATTSHAAPPGTTTFTESFEGGHNTGGWSLGNMDLEAIDPIGGHPGAYLHFPDLDTYAPQPRTTAAGSVFTGNYREQGVSAVGIDLVLHRVDFSSADRPVAVILTSDGGTPDDFFDDCSIYQLGNKPGPSPNSIWRGYKFKVPSDSATMPRGWNVLNCAESDADAAWNRVIQDVDELRFHVGDPTLFFIFQVWDFGMDNPTITWGTPEAPVAPASWEVERTDTSGSTRTLQRR
ncbi:MAG TPA: hypothetical protein VFV75_05490 [Candidatus Polarisedimenticolaceae bacterium]|nr:hypothetical protein [Candidatus Polarisedimenticolaceae bacterium]